MTVVDLTNVGDETKGCAEIVVLEVLFTHSMPGQSFTIEYVDGVSRGPRRRSVRSRYPLIPPQRHKSGYRRTSPSGHFRTHAPHKAKPFYGISYTANSSAIPRSDARCRTGSRLLVLRIDEEPGCSTTGPVAKIEREAARP